MHIVFDPDFDSGAWPGPLEDCGAVVGELWLGPVGFLSQLEARLGLGGPGASQVDRIASLLKPVRQIEGFWNRSAEADLVETAATLLRWRDLLWDAGWRGEPLSQRLAELASVTAGVPPGFADRLEAVQQAVTHRSPEIAALELLRKPEHLPRAWQRILRTLYAHGTGVTVRRLEPQSTSSDLEGARSRGFSPRGDGSLQLLRTYGPLQAAEEVAAWLAAKESLDSTVVIGADPTLDRALHRHGLPTTGARATGHDALLRVLPLVLDLGWHPADPQRALELLTLPLQPLPAVITRGLIKALSEWPAVDSDAWRQQLDRGLARIEDDGRRRRARRNVATIFRRAADYGGGYPSAEIRERAGIVQQWLRASSTTGEHDQLPWQGALQQCTTLLGLLDSAQQDDFNAPQLQRLLELATRGVSRPRLFPSQAGLAAVERPGAIAGGARRIVWWGFSLDRVPPLQSLPLTAGEVEALAGADITLPDRGRGGEDLAWRWRRPLLAARSALLLVCPFKGENGEDLFPHPLWDEICANLDRHELAARLEQATPISPRAGPRQTRSLEPVPEFQRSWKLAADSVARREKESPSSAGGLIGCSFKWVGEYAGRLRGGNSQALPDDGRVLGSLAHEILARILATDAVPKPAAAAKQAAELFDREAPRCMASLFLPGADARQAATRRQICQAAEVLCAHLTRHRRRVLSVESPRARTALGTTFEGRPDLVVGPSPAVIDLKWGGAGYHRGSLTRGTAYQLASYSYLVAEHDAALPPVAYFILRDQQLLTTDPDAFPDAERVHGPPIAATWAAFERAHAAAWQRLREGELEAPWPMAEKAEDTLEDGVLSLKPPCHFCDLGTLCGAAFTEDA